MKVAPCSRTIESDWVIKSVSVDGSTVTKSPREPPVAIVVCTSVFRFTSTSVPPLVLAKMKPENSPVPTAVPSSPLG